jgi:hypothetical protein
MEIYKEDYESGIKAVKAQIKDFTIQLMILENTLELLEKQVKSAKPAPKKDVNKQVSGVG